VKKYFITGGSGFIGRNLVLSLAKEGHQIRVYDDLSRGKTYDFLYPNVELIQGDVKDSKALTIACKGFDSFVHLAAVNGTSNFYSRPKVVFEVAVRGTLNALDACVENEIEQFVFASTAEVYGDSEIIPTPEDARISIIAPFADRYSYGGSKLVGELMTRYIGQGQIDNVLTFRPHNVYGPEMGFEHVIPQFVEKIISGETSPGKSSISIQGSGNETRAFAFIDDVIDGIKILLGKGESGQTYHIGNPTETSIQDLALAISGLLNFSLDIVHGDLSPNSPLRRVPNIEKISRLGYKPKTNLLEGLSKTIPWYVENNPRT